MKRYIFILITVFSTVYAVAYEGYANVYTYNNRQYSGNTISVTDSILTIRSDKSFATLEIPLSDIVYGTIGKNYFISNEGVFTEVTRDQYFAALYAIAHGKAPEIRAKTTVDYSQRASDPNYVIGKAMKEAGSVGLCLGVPSTVIGTILLGVGYSKTPIKRELEKHPYMAEEIAEKYSRVCISGVMLFSIGAPLTLVGAPLYVGGKNVMNLKVTTTGNSVGAKLEF